MIVLGSWCSIIRVPTCIWYSSKHQCQNPPSQTVSLLSQQETANAPLPLSATQEVKSKVQDVAKKNQGRNEIHTDKKPQTSFSYTYPKSANLPWDQWCVQDYPRHLGATLFAATQLTCQFWTPAHQTHHRPGWFNNSINPTWRDSSNTRDKLCARLLAKFLY